MTDRIHALTIILDRDIRKDDIEDLVNALKYIKFVADVKLETVMLDDMIARSRVVNDLRFTLHKAIEKILDGELRITENGTIEQE